MPLALFALTIAAYAIGTTEFVIVGLLSTVATDLNITLPLAGLIVSVYALGVTFGAPVLTALTGGIGRKKLLVGLMALFTLIVLAQLIVSSGPIGYDKWAGIFSSQWMKTLTFSVILALLYHVWVGVRDIWMDYIKPTSVRIMLHVLTLLVLVGCAGWAIQIIWRL